MRKINTAGWFVVLGMFSLIALMQGCLPSKLVLDLDPEPSQLYERVHATGDSARRSGSKIALIRVDGFIANTPIPAVFGMSPNPTDELVRRLDKAAGDSRVRGVLLVVNSPGGTITGSETMYNEVMRFRARTGKPVVVSMGEIATSGGYYISMAGDYIYANPTTLTGSIGVMMQMMNVSRGLEMIGVEARSITSGPNKAMGTPLEPIVEDHYEIFQELTDEFYLRFVEKVTSRRAGFDVGVNAWATDGRVVSGTTALSIGLVDALGGVREAFEEAKRLAGVDGAQLVSYVPTRVKGSASPFAAQVGGERRALAQAESSVVGRVPGFGFLSLPAGFYYLWMPGVE